MMNEVKNIDLQDMTSLREVSQRISQYLNKVLSGHLKTLSPLFSPRKVLGEFMESAFKEKVPGADKIFARFEENYRNLCRDTFDIPSKLSTPIPNIKNQLESYPWSYMYKLEGGTVLNVSSPVRWVLSYSGGYNLSRLLENHLQGEKPRYDDLRDLLLKTLTMWLLIDASPGLRELMKDLRFMVSIETSQVSGGLPFVVISSPVPAFRPQDDLIRTVVQLSGRPVFEELVDIAGIEDMSDPLRVHLQEIESE